MSSAQGKLGVIDIGTQSVLFLLVELNSDGDLIIQHQAMASTRLGEGLHSQSIQLKPLQRTIHAIKSFVNDSRDMGGDTVIAVGTRVFRAAINGSAVCAEIYEQTGVTVTILSEREEALYGFLSATRGLESDDRVTVIDIGGGSTEITLGKQGIILNWQSIPVGAVTLAEKQRRVITTNPPLPDLQSELLQQSMLLGVGGTITTLAALHLDMRVYDADKVDNLTLSRETIEQYNRILHTSSLSERQKLMAIDPARADILPAGTEILLNIMDAGGAGQIIVRDQGVRFGVAMQRLGVC